MCFDYFRISFQQRWGEIIVWKKKKKSPNKLENVEKFFRNLKSLFHLTDIINEIGNWQIKILTGKGATAAPGSTSASKALQ